MAVEIKPRTEILLPNIKLVPHRDGGWALPGGGVTFDVNEAAEIARDLERTLGRDKPYNEADYLAERTARAARRRP